MTDTIKAANVAWARCQLMDDKPVRILNDKDDTLWVSLNDASKKIGRNATQLKRSIVAWFIGDGMEEKKDPHIPMISKVLPCYDGIYTVKFHSGNPLLCANIHDVVTYCVNKEHLVEFGQWLKWVSTKMDSTSSGELVDVHEEYSACLTLCSLASPSSSS